MSNIDPEKPIDDIEKLPVDLKMQVDLVLRFYGLKKESITKDDLDSYILKWAGADSKQFSAEFRNALEKNPELLTLYEINPELALSKMEDLIYEKAA